MHPNHLCVEPRSNTSIACPFWRSTSLGLCDWVVSTFVFRTFSCSPTSAKHATSSSNKNFVSWTFSQKEGYHQRILDPRVCACHPEITNWLQQKFYSQWKVRKTDSSCRNLDVHRIAARLFPPILLMGRLQAYRFCSAFLARADSRRGESVAWIHPYSRMDLSRLFGVVLSCGIKDWCHDGSGEPKCILSNWGPDFWCKFHRTCRPSTRRITLWQFFFVKIPPQWHVTSFTWPLEHSDWKKKRPKRFFVP